MFILILLRTLLISRTALALENLALRHQLAVLERSVPRPRLQRRDRLLWVLLRRVWSGWQNCLIIVQPPTVVAWHRQGWRLVWRLRSRGKPGRPAISLELRELIRRLSRENRLWGAPRIQAELERLGFKLAKSTIEKYMARRAGPPSGKWRAFLHNHAGEILACDFFTVPTVSFKTLTGFVVLELGRRRILACGVTAHPTAAWAAKLVERAVITGGRSARFIVRDRDSIYGTYYRAAVRGLGLRQVVTAYRSPLQNAHAERVIGTIRRECLDHILVISEGHARRVLDEFVTYYNKERTHQALGPESPVPREDTAGAGKNVISVPRLGGLHHSYRRAA
jgi:transposase InsO family protein